MEPIELIKTNLIWKVVTFARLNTLKPSKIRTNDPFVAFFLYVLRRIGDGFHVIIFIANHEMSYNKTAYGFTRTPCFRSLAVSSYLYSWFL